MGIKISVSMANYNNAEYIAQAIDSVLTQHYSDWELLVCDDASCDESKTVLISYSRKEKIRVLLNHYNIGYIDTLNKLAMEAKGDIILILDSDDALAPEALLKVADAFEQNDGVCLVYSQCYYCNEKLKPLHLGFSRQIPIGKSNLQLNAINALRAYRKRDFDKTPGFNRECLYAEDIDLNLKMEEVGKLCFLDEPLYYYRILEKSQSHGFRNTQINRSSTALAKLNAYKRRLKTDIPSLDKDEMAEVLFFGILTAILSIRAGLIFKFLIELFKINPLFFLKKRFYSQLNKKVKKILVLKKEKPLLKI